MHYTSMGQIPAFSKAVSEMDVRERCLFRFPKPSHPYYTKQALAGLEAQYPGFNASGAYAPVD